jgi:predicted ester cyclase
MSLRVLPAAVLLCSVTLAPGCKDKGGGAPEGAASSDAAGAKAAPAQSPNERRAAAFAECYARLNGRRFDELGKCYAENVSSRHLGFEAAYTGRAKAMDMGAKGFMTAFPDGSAEPQLTLVNGNEIVALVLFRGTHKAALEGPLGKTPPTGKKVGYMSLHRVQMNEKDEIIAEWWTMDTNTLLVQLGLSDGMARPVIADEWPTRPVVLAKEDPTEQKNVQSYLRTFELFGQKNPEMFEFYSDDIIESNVASPEDTMGRREMREANMAFWKGFSDVHVAFEKNWGAGDYTVGIGRLKGTNDGEMPAMGLDKSGRKLDLPFVEVTRWDRGKFLKTYIFMNGLEMAKQLGMLPANNDSARR